MNASLYILEPIDLSGITLPEGLDAVCERLARNTHEVWASQRMAEGWRYGPVCDDAPKRHPCLVPYEELPESEKEYDRKTSMESLKLIHQFGYRS